MTWKGGLLLPVITILVGLLSVVSATQCPSCQNTGCVQNKINYGVCRTAYYSSHSYSVSQWTTVQRSTQYTSACGWWWASRCTRIRYWSERVMTYHREYRRQFQCADQCCSGWYNTSNSPCICEPLCSGGCHNGGTCIDTNMCHCTMQWTGPNCQNHNNGNCTHMCHNGGTCIDPNVCQCTPDWTGPWCETALCTGGCLNGGECVLPETCNCTTGWTGTNCGTDIDECRNNTIGCDHNCTNTPGGYFCDCQNGFLLANDRHMCNDIDECNSTDNGGCDQICSNTPGSYKCSCNEGFTMIGENETCVEETQVVLELLDSTGAATVSGVTVAIIVASLVLCVVVAIAMKRRAPFCRKATMVPDKTEEAEPTPENYGGVELTPNPAYSAVAFTKTKSQAEKAQPAGDDGDDGDDVTNGNMYVSIEEQPTYENLQVLY